MHPEAKSGRQQRAIPAMWMRGGTSKGIFFEARDLPDDPAARDAILLRVLGSPDPYGKQIDGLGGASSSTSKVVLVAPSQRPDCDIDYWFGAVAIEAPIIDWSGNCGNLTAAVGPFAIHRRLIPVPADHTSVTVRIWQANIGKRILAHVPVHDGSVVEGGDFLLDGVAFAAAPIRLEFLDPGADEAGPGAGPGMFPTGRCFDRFEVPGAGSIEATCINAGNPTVFLDAGSLGLTATESQQEINADSALLARFEGIRATAAVAMGLAASTGQATRERPATPKVAIVARPAAYVTSSGRTVDASEVDLLVRILSMGRLHHAMTGTGAVALAVAAAVPGTVVSRLLADGHAGQVRMGHPSGTLEVGAGAELIDGEWKVSRAVMNRSARRLMSGDVWVP